MSRGAGGGPVMLISAQIGMDGKQCELVGSG